MIHRRTFLTLLAASAAGPAAGAAPPIELPLRFSAGTLWASVLIEGTGPHRFIVHTGQTFFMVSRKLAQSLELRKRNVDVEGAYTPSGEIELDVHVAREFQLGSAFRMKDVELIARDYHGEDVFAGTIPYLPAMPTTFDFEAWKLLFHKEGFAPPAGAARLKLLRAKGAAISTVPVVEAELDGHPIRLGLNTGSLNAVSLFPGTVRRLKLWDAYPRKYGFAYDDREFGRSETRVARVGQLKLGGVRIEEPVVTMGDPRLGARGVDLQADGSIGMDVLRRFNISFEPKAMSAWLRPIPERMHDAYLYDRTGFDSQPQEDGSSLVVTVFAGGPADKAGLRVGDRLAKVSPEEEVERAFSRLRMPGTAIDFAIERDGKPMTVTITLEELI